MVIVGGTAVSRTYGCSGNKNGGFAICANGISVRQNIVEARLLTPIKTGLLSLEQIPRHRSLGFNRLMTRGRLSPPSWKHYTLLV
jgi:hypothetical protein